MHPRQRRVIIAFIFILLLPLGSLYASVDYRSYPEEYEIVVDSANSSGDDILLFTDILKINDGQKSMIIQLEDERVVDINSHGITRQAEYRKNITVQLDNTSLHGTIREDSYIQVYGILRDESTVIDAEVVVVDYQDSSDYIYMYGISILGALFAVVYFFQHWQINLRDWCFEIQEENDG